MNAVKEDVEKLVQKELESANKKFPMFRSDHEGAAVTFEEIQETEEMLSEVKKYFSSLWKSVKDNCADYAEYEASKMKNYAILVACEAIQVAAMSQKFVDSQKEREKSEDNQPEWID